jgi:two-component system phosphate regulon response regulator PhoB
MVSAAPPPSVLVVEDDENLRVVLRDNLEEEGYRVADATTAAAARAALDGGSYDLVVLDVMLPDGDGYALCRQLRAAGNPARVLMLTARALEDDLVTGLDAGADDYLVKPYRLRELLARVRALLRRGAEPASAAPEILSCAGYRVDLRAREVFTDAGASVSLTRTEFDLLRFLLQHPGRAIPREEILTAVWGSGLAIDDHTVDNFVSQLKRKLGPGVAIRTIRGVGYRLDLQPA